MTPSVLSGDGVCRSDVLGLALADGSAEAAVEDADGVEPLGVGVPVGTVPGSLVGTDEGLDVGLAVALADGLVVGRLVALAVGFELGFDVGLAVGAAAETGVTAGAVRDPLSWKTKATHPPAGTLSDPTPWVE